MAVRVSSCDVCVGTCQAKKCVVVYNNCYLQRLVELRCCIMLLALRVQALLKKLGSPRRL